MRWIRSEALGAVLVTVSLLVASCGSGSSEDGSTTATPPYAPTIVAADFTDQITNRYFPLIPGTVFTYETTVDGVAQENVVTVTHETKTIVGVHCVVVHDVVSEEGQVVEDTFDWYTQDTDGNVWYFGEDTKEYENGNLKSTAGSWETGVDGAQPGIVMEAEPKVGDSYQQEYYAGEAEDTGRVTRLGAAIDVPAGSYTNVLVTEETTPLEPDVLEEKYYAPDVGFIYSKLIRGGSEEARLVSVTTS